MTVTEALPWIQALSAPVTALLASVGAITAASIQAAGSRGSSQITATAVSHRDAEEIERRLATSRIKLIALAEVIASEAHIALVTKALSRRRTELDKFVEYAYKKSVADALSPSMLVATFRLARSVSQYREQLDEHVSSSKAAVIADAFLIVRAHQVLADCVDFFHAVGDIDRADRFGKLHRTFDRTPYLQQFIDSSELPVEVKAALIAIRDGAPLPWEETKEK